MMRKVLFIILLLTLCCATLSAAPAKKGVQRTITLADGTQVVAELKGDEFCHYWETADGRLFDMRESILDRQTIEQALAEKRRQTMSRAVGTVNSTTTGKQNCIVILVNFTDCKFEDDHDVEFYTRLTNEEGFSDERTSNEESVRDYFLAQSYDMLDITFDVFGPVELKHEYAYYGGEMDYAYEMITEAIAGAYDEGADFSKYDWDGDGEVEVCYVLYAGHGAASWDDDDTVWPHMSKLSYYTTRPSYNGTKLNTYACSNELSGLAESGSADGIGTMCHEFSHCLGLPDMYDTEYTGNYGMSYWSVLASGCYLGSNSGFEPAGYTSYERMFCGWLTPIELNSETNVSGMKGLSEGGEAYIIYNAGNSNEYYLLENRVQTGTDSALLGEGMLVLHVDYNKSLWSKNWVNVTGSSYLNNDHQRLTIIPADNNFTQTSMAIGCDPYPYTGNTRLDNTSTPAATTYNLNTDGTLFMNCSISKIQLDSSDRTISFTFYPAGTNPNHGNKPDGAIFYESFDYCAGKGGNDGNFSTTTMSVLQADNDGWACASAKGAYECAFFGSTSYAATVTFPTFTITEDTYLTFRAAPFSAKVAGELSLWVEESGITLSETSFEIAQGEWTDCTVKLSGKGEVTLKMKETVGIKRFFLDEVAAVPQSAVGITTPTVEQSDNNSRIYNLAGQQLESKPAKGAYIVGGKKVM